MLAILINPNNQTKQIVELPDGPAELRQSILALLDCKEIKYIQDSSESMNLVVNLACFASTDLGIRLPGLFYALFGKILVTAWCKDSQSPVSLQPGTDPATFEVEFLNAADSAEERLLPLEAFREILEERARNN